MTALSIIIPTLNESKRLPLILADTLLWEDKVELIISDAGSSDLTTHQANLLGGHIINVGRGNRGLQLHRGALIANSDWLLFLHADSRMKKNWVCKVQEIISLKYSEKQAWYFELKLNKKNLAFYILEKIVSIRSRFLQRPYGDQGLLIRRDLYFQMNGFKPYEIMEDLDFVLRASRHIKFKSLGIPLITDSRRWEKFNLITNSYKNAILRYQWRRGVPARELAKKYYSK